MSRAIEQKRARDDESSIAVDRCRTRSSRKGYPVVLIHMPYLNISGIHTRKYNIQLQSTYTYKKRMCIYKHTRLPPSETCRSTSSEYSARLQRAIRWVCSPLDRGSTGNVSHSWAVAHSCRLHCTALCTAHVNLSDRGVILGQISPRIYPPPFASPKDFSERKERLPLFQQPSKLST